MMKHRDLLETLFRIAVDAANPLEGMKRHLPEPPPKGRTVVIGAGKAAAQMAAALEKLWPAPITGLVVTRYGYACPTDSIEVVEAAHPVPDSAGLAAARRIQDILAPLNSDDLVIALISGGGSALMPSPPPGASLEDEIALNQMLLASGAPISAMNTLRKHLSMIKGGRLAAATKARIVSLIMSDVPGDNPAFVASGPTVPDHTTRADAISIVKEYQLTLPPALHDFLYSDAADAPRPDDPVFEKHSWHVVASAGLSLSAAADKAASLGYSPYILSDSIEGESRVIAGMHAALAREVSLRNQPFQKPAIILSGGETGVTLSGEASKTARGGRNSEFALALALSIEGHPLSALAADTDGIDGYGGHAGAFVDGTTAKRLRACGVDGRAMLAQHDSYSCFERIGDLFMTGPTGTNVNDFRAIVVE